MQVWGGASLNLTLRDSLKSQLRSRPLNSHSWILEEELGMQSLASQMLPFDAPGLHAFTFPFCLPSIWPARQLSICFLFDLMVPREFNAAHSSQNDILSGKGWGWGRMGHTGLHHSTDTS